MKRGVYWRLSVMMFLQYAIWGAWFPYLSQYLVRLGFAGLMISVIYNLLPFGILLSPVTGGQLADRYFPTEKLLAVANLLGAILLWAMGGLIDLGAMPVKTAFLTLSGIMLVYTIIYGPTLALSNSISFSHLANVEKQFGAIRVWGTIGWIAGGVCLTTWWEFIGAVRPNDCLLLAAVFSLVLGLFSFVLPHTPPKREGVEPLAFAKAFRMLRDRNFAAFMLISFIVITELYFYYILTAPFLASAIGIREKNIPLVLTTAQIGEILTMAILLPILLPRLGVRVCLALGVIAWPIRYAVFVIQDPWWLVVASLPIHGFCYVFFFVVGQIYVDNEATKDIRASAQALWAVFVLGIGAIVGGFFAGGIYDVFTPWHGPGSVRSVAVSADGTKALTANGESEAKLWDFGQGREIRVFLTPEDRVNCQAYKPVVSFAEPTSPILSAALSPDGTHVLTGGQDSVARLWNAEDGKELRAFSGHTSRVTSVALSPDGTKALTASDDRTVRLWNVADGSEIRALAGHTASVLSVAFSPDGSRILTAGADQTAKLWNAADGSVLHTLAGHTSTVVSAVFSPDGSKALTASLDGSARLWDLAQGNGIRAFSRNTSPVLAATFSPNGTSVLTGSMDNTAVLWNASDGTTVSLYRHGDAVSAVAFSPDGTRVLTGSRDKTVRIWNRSDGSLAGSLQEVTMWRAVFLVPMIVTILCAMAFLAFFREPERKQPSEEEAAA